MKNSFLKFSICRILTLIVLSIDSTILAGNIPSSEELYNARRRTMPSTFQINSICFNVAKKVSNDGMMGKSEYYEYSLKTNSISRLILPSWTSNVHARVTICYYPDNSSQEAALIKELSNRAIECGFSFYSSEDIIESSVRKSDNRIIERRKRTITFLLYNKPISEATYRYLITGDRSWIESLPTPHVPHAALGASPAWA